MVMRLALGALLAAPLAVLVQARDPAAHLDLTSRNVDLNAAAIPDPTSEFTFTVPLDHFAPATVGQKTFPMRVLRYTGYRNKEVKEVGEGDGIIFFYSGNEGSIDSFWNNTGLVFAWAKELSEKEGKSVDVVFAEHRYYGKSLPFGDSSFDSFEKLQYLRVEQAMADYALFMKEYNKNGKWKVVTFGGSYGGVLSALLRMHYPTLFHAALAASAPLPQTVDMIPETTFYKAVTADAENYKPECVTGVKSAFASIKAAFDAAATAGDDDENSVSASAASASGLSLADVTKQFDLCEPLKASDWSYFMQYVRNAWTTVAMCDYPYPASFLAPLPAFPVNAACDKVVDGVDKTGGAVAGLAAATNMVYNTDTGPLGGKDKCRDMRTLFIECADQTGCGVGNDAKAWDFQMCSDVTIVVSSDNKTDMFPYRKWNLDSLKSYCAKKYWGVQPNPEEMAVRYGISELRKGNAPYSNIIFSNGDLDPWHPGGYLEDLSESLVALRIPKGAHHLDLRMPQSDDPADVVEVREKEKALIKQWLAAYDPSSSGSRLEQEKAFEPVQVTSEQKQFVQSIFV